MKGTMKIEVNAEGLHVSTHLENVSLMDKVYILKAFMDALEVDKEEFGLILVGLDVLNLKVFNSDTGKPKENPIFSIVDGGKKH